MSTMLVPLTFPYNACASCVHKAVHPVLRSVSHETCEAPTPSPIAMKTELWQRLRMARKVSDLTQSELADYCGVSRNAVALWEAGEPNHRTRPTVENLQLIATATGLPLEWLLNDASELEDAWKLAVYNEAMPRSAKRRNDSIHEPRALRVPEPDVLPDIYQDGHRFYFAQTAEQFKAKLKQIQKPPGLLDDQVKKHLILLMAGATVHQVETPSDAIAKMMQILNQSK